MKQFESHNLAVTKQSGLIGKFYFCDVQLQPRILKLHFRSDNSILLWYTYGLAGDLSLPSCPLGALAPVSAVALFGLREGDAAGGDAQRRGEDGAHVGGVELGVWGGIQWKNN